MSKSRREIRNEIRNARNAIDESTRAQWSTQISQRMMQLEAFKKSTKVAAVLAFEGEANPIGLMLEAIESGKQVFVPIIIAKAQPLKFAPWNPEIELRTNDFGILEPAVDPSQYVEANELDFVATPLVAFDTSCNRIGVGGGFYDRTFEFLNSEDDEKGQLKSESDSDPHLNKSVVLAGFAFELQRVDSIESKSWDVPLDWVVTEGQVYAR